MVHAPSPINPHFLFADFLWFPRRANLSSRPRSARRERCNKERTVSTLTPRLRAISLGSSSQQNRRWAISRAFGRSAMRAPLTAFTARRERLVVPQRSDAGCRSAEASASRNRKTRGPPLRRWKSRRRRSASQRKLWKVRSIEDERVAKRMRSSAKSWKKSSGDGCPLLLASVSIRALASQSA